MRYFIIDNTTEVNFDIRILDKPSIIYYTDIVKLTTRKSRPDILEIINKLMISNNLILTSLSDHDNIFLLGIFIAIHGYHSRVYLYDKSTNEFNPLNRGEYLHLFSPLFIKDGISEFELISYLGYVFNKKDLKKRFYIRYNKLNSNNKILNLNETSLVYKFYIDKNFYVNLILG